MQREQLTGAKKTLHQEREPAEKALRNLEDLESQLQDALADMSRLTEDAKEKNAKIDAAMEEKKRVDEGLSRIQICEHFDAHAETERLSWALWEKILCLLEITSQTEVIPGYVFQPSNEKPDVTGCIRVLRRLKVLVSHPLDIKDGKSPKKCLLEKPLTARPMSEAMSQHRKVSLAGDGLSSAEARLQCCEIGGERNSGSRGADGRDALESSVACLPTPESDFLPRMGPVEVSSGARRTAVEGLEFVSVERRGGSELSVLAACESGDAQLALRRVEATARGCENEGVVQAVTGDVAGSGGTADDGRLFIAPSPVQMVPEVEDLDSIGILSGYAVRSPASKQAIYLHVPVPADPDAMSPLPASVRRYIPEPGCMSRSQWIVIVSSFSSSDPP